MKFVNKRVRLQGLGTGCLDFAICVCRGLDNLPNYFPQKSLDMYVSRVQDPSSLERVKAAAVASHNCIDILKRPSHEYKHKAKPFDPQTKQASEASPQQAMYAH